MNTPSPRGLAALAALTLAALTPAPAALAHATLDTAEASAGSTARISLRVPHGCDGQATHTVELTLPEGFYAAKPMPKAGWELTTETGAYDTPYNNHGTEMTEGLRKVVWSGGDLEDGWYDEFTVRGTVGPDIAPGTVLYFPALQLCADGTTDWTDTSGAADSAHPSPSLTVTAATGGGHGHGHHGGHGDQAAMEHGAPVTLGALEITGAFTRATLPNAPVGGGFLTITNTGDSDDRLIGATSPVAGRVEVHEMSMQGDVMKMRELADGLPIPAGETVVLKPGGYHLMLMELQDSLSEGTMTPVTLTFERAGEVEVQLAVGAPNAKDADHSAHAGHSGDKN